jgi:hypothetical protein
MSNANKYLGPHKKVGPNSYELAPIPVRAERLNPGLQGFFSGAWGLNQGPHRGTSQSSVKLSPLTPFIWDDLMHETSINSTYIDSEYIGIFNNLFPTSIGELEYAKQTASGTHPPSSIEKAKAEQAAAFKLIQTKSVEYEARKPSAYSLYGHNPFFLMKELSFRKIFESVHTSPPDVSIAYTAIDTAYRSALELKRISLQKNILAKQLENLAHKRNQAESEGQLANSTSLLDEKFSTINDEINVHFDLLPQFLLEKITGASGVAIGLSLAQSLTSYKSTINNLIASEQAAVGAYAIANPAITSPLSTPELEALNNLVDLQANTNLGKRWQDYHSSLLHTEVARHLTETSNAFSGLIARSLEVERQQEKLRIEIERQQEQLRIEAERQREKMRIEAERQQETMRIDAERQRIAAEQEAYQQALALEKIQKESALRKKYQIENVDLSTASGDVASVRPLVVTPDGLIAGFEGSPFSLARSIETLSLPSNPLGIFLASVFYTPTLGNGELQRNPVVVSIPLSQLGSGIDSQINSNNQSEANLPLRILSSATGEHTQLYLAKTGAKLSTRVRVRTVKLDTTTGLYTFTTEGFLPRTLTWTPNSAPGKDIIGSTELPSEQNGINIYPGARVTQLDGRADEHPSYDDFDLDDYVLVFPTESGIDPIYIMLSRTGPRHEPGTASGVGRPTGENWLGDASTSGGSPIPSQIADALRGQDFRNFDKFRERFWKEVASDLMLRGQFKKVDLEQMTNGAAPYAEPLDSVGGREKIEIHHKQRITDGGAVYDLDNLSILTPKAHIELHKKGDLQ